VRVRASGVAVLGGLIALTLVASGTAAVVLQDDGAPARPAPAPVRTPLPAPTPAPSRTPLLPAAGEQQTAGVPSGAAIAAAADATVADPALGGRIAVSVVDVGATRVLYERAADLLLLPASTAKLVTAVSALTTLPLDRRLRTRVVAGATPGEVVVVGAGDPTIAASAATMRSPQDARLDVLAQQVVAALGPIPVQRVVVDDSLYSGASTGPGWQPQYVAEGDVAAVDALAVDAGRLRPDAPARAVDPGLAAGTTLADLLSRGGAVPEVVRGQAPRDARELGAVEGPPVSELVERMLTSSDNDLAETLARQVAIATGHPADFDGVAHALSETSAAVLEPLGVRGAAVHLVDGSGLSRDDRIAPGALTRLLAGVLGDPDPERQRRLAPLLSGLPVAGFDGTLEDRFRRAGETAGAGVVRAKTGTLRGVSALAGVVRTQDGRLLSFAVSSDGVPDGATGAAQAALDRFAAALAACGCH
jgi:D-alanyl-D-alanine carboxypeptidase/D-alanyl-D-alanine-endopeptidase (penicillin-binding protein 4)